MSDVSPKPRRKVSFSGDQSSTITYGAAMYLRGHPWARSAVAVLGVLSVVVGAACFIKPQLYAAAFIFGTALSPSLLYVAVIAGEESELTFPIEQAAEER